MSADHTDHPEEIPHAYDQAAEVAHAWHHFRENAFFFAGFLTIILLTVFAFNVNFGPTGNVVAIFILAALRSGLIAFFFVHLLGTFSFLVRTSIFTIIFFAGMVVLSIWDSPLPRFGDPIANHNDSAPLNHVP
jgi:heme/copper-type cytochrome/quinol oxidase subunit 4